MKFSAKTKKRLSMAILLMIYGLVIVYLAQFII